MKAPLELVEHRAKYYERIIKSLLRAVGVDISRLEFVLGSSYQLGKEYTMDRFKLEGVTRISVAQKAGAEVVKQTDDPTLGGLIYPLMQALDEQYLDVDAQFGGVDQRKIFTFAIENLPRIGYKTRAHLMNTMVPGLGDAVKMSASDPDSKIDLLDGEKAVEKKLKKTVCAPTKVEGNGVIAFVEHVIFRATALKNGGTPKFVVERRDAEPLVYDNIEKLRADYQADIVSPLRFSHILSPVFPLSQPLLTAAPANAPTPQIRPDHRPQRPPGAHPRRVRSGPRMAETRGARLPGAQGAREAQGEDEEGQGRPRETGGGGGGAQGPSGSAGRQRGGAEREGEGGGGAGDGWDGGACGGVGGGEVDLDGLGSTEEGRGGAGR